MARAGSAWVDFKADFSELDRQVASKLPALSKSVEKALDPKQAKGFNRELGATSKTVTTTDRNFVSLGRSIGDANRNATFFRNALGLIKWPALIAGAGAATQGLSALGAGATALTSALAPLSGALAAYPALLTTIGQVSGTTALAGIEDLTGVVGGLNEKLDETSDEFKRLTPEAQAFAKQLQDLKAPFRALSRDVQGTLFEGLNDGIADARQNMPALRDVVNSTARAMGNLAERTGHFLGREGFGRDFATIGRHNAQLLERWGGAGLHLADALRHVMVEARPLLDWMARSAAGFSRLIEDEAQAARESGRLADYFEKTRDVMERVTSIGGSLAGVFQEIGHAAAPLGNEILSSLDEGADNLERWAESTRGRSDLREYFEDARKPIFEIGRLIGDATKAFFEMSRSPGLTNFIRQFRTELLPTLTDLVKTTTRDFGPALIDFLVQGSKLMANFVGSAGPLTVMVRLFTEATKAVNALFENVEGLASVMSTLASGAAIGKLFGAFSKVGAEGGAAVTRGFGANLGLSAVIGGAAAALTTSGGVLDTLKGEGASWGRDFAASIAQAFGPKLEKAITNHSLPALRKVSTAVRAYVDQMHEMGFEVPPELEAMAQKGERSFQRLSAAMVRVKDKINDLSVTWHGGMRSINRDTEQNMKAIEQSFGSHSRRGKQLLSENFDAAIDAIRNSMEAGKIATERGQRMIQDILGRQLKLFGVKPQDVFDATTRSTSGDSMPKGGHWTGQRGGPIDMGAPVGDSVPAMLERGEYVLNRKAVSTVGKGVLDKINFGLAKRFQSGGGVGLQPGISQLADVLRSRFGMGLTSGYRAGDDGFHGQGLAGDFAGGSWRGASRYVNSIGASLLEGIYNPAVFGGTPVSWDSGSPVSSGFWGSDWAAHQDHIHAAIAGALGARSPGAAGAPAKLRLPRFSSSFAAGAVAAGGLNRNAMTLEKVIGERVNARTAGGAFSGFTGGAWTGVMRKIAQSRGWSFGDWMKLVQGESGGNPEATNPSSGAFGLGQFLGSTLDAYAPYGAASHDPVKQIQAMAKYISDRYGTPSSAYSTWLSRSPHWYREGGLVGGAQKLAKGGLAKLFPQLGAKKGPRRHKALGQILDKVKGLGLDPDTFKQLNTLTNDSGIFQEFADRASQLTIEPFDETGEAILGKVNGLSEVEWLNKALETVFGLRNSLIGAESKVSKRMTQVGEMIELAKGRVQKLFDLLRDTNDAIQDNERRQQRIVKEIETARAKLEAEIAKPQPQRSQGAIDHQRSRIERLRGDLAQLGEKKAALLGVRTRATLERGTLTEKVIREMTTKRSDLVTLRGDVLGSGGEGFDGLVSVQGLGSPLGALTQLPEFGVLGGTIFDLQSRLRELNAPKETITDSLSDSGGETENESAEILKQLLQESNRRLAVSQAQYSVFAGMFAEGGKIPSGAWGIAGETGIPEIIQGPATVYSPSDSRQMLSDPTPEVNVTIVMPSQALAKEIEVYVDGKIAKGVERVTRQQANRAVSYR